MVTCILYAGEKEWDGPRSLREMLDFADIPEDLQELIQDYRINLIEIRKLQDTNVFQTDIRQVFDFIRCAGDKNALKELTQNDPAFRSMEEDAFDVMVQYANVPELVGIKDDYGKEGKIDMCKGLADWIAEEREAGIETGREEGREESRNETIQTMLAADIDVAIILKAGFTMEEIEKAGGRKKER